MNVSRTDALRDIPRASVRRYLTGAPFTYIRLIRSPTSIFAGTSAPLITSAEDGVLAIERRLRAQRDVELRVGLRGIAGVRHRNRPRGVEVLFENSATPTGLPLPAAAPRPH